MKLPNAIDTKSGLVAFLISTMMLTEMQTRVVGLLGKYKHPLSTSYIARYAIYKDSYDKGESGLNGYLIPSKDSVQGAYYQLTKMKNANLITYVPRGMWKLNNE